ncbi:MAG: IgGFc-binding protein [Myxococcales bacterium]|nr:IgGFc-binding protein [Myxococcales bacterium]
MNWLGGALSALVLGASALFVACSSDEAAPVDAGVDAPIFNPTGCQGTRCSSDLHEVLDCNDQVIKRCPEGEGCTPGGSCIPACESARLNKSTLGCEYYAVDPGTDGSADGSCFAAFVANTWTAPLNLAVAYDGKDLDVSTFARVPVGSGPALRYDPLPSGQLPPGQVAILFLADFAAPGVPSATRCPAGVTAAVSNGLASSSKTAILKAFSIRTTAPVVAYDMFPYGGAASYISSATLLVPVSAWGDNYVGVTGFPRGPAVPVSSLSQPFLQIAAAEDGTEVTVRPSAAIVGDTGVAPSPANTPQTYSLAKGQVLQLKQNEDLTGSIVKANKPVGVWGGSSCMYIEVTDNACDSAHQQLVPARALGTRYIGARYRDRLQGREEAPPWRIVGVVDGTQLSYEPSPPVGAPTTIQSGQSVIFRANAAFVVKSQDGAHPFYLAGHMTGQQSSGLDFGVGDPEFVSAVATEQYLRSYVFMTDPTMSFTNLVITRLKGPKGFADVELDCGGKLVGWQPVGNTGDLQFTRFDMVVSGNGVGACNNGRHSIKSDQPFGLTVWGWDKTVSYAYPAGASIAPINEVVVPVVK